MNGYVPKDDSLYDTIQPSEFWCDLVFCKEAIAYARNILVQEQPSMTEVTLNLSEPMIAHAKKLGLATQRNVDTVLTDTLEMLWLTLEETPDLAEASVSELPDHALLALADSKMNESQNQRLGNLQAKGKAERLTDAERYELLALLQIYQLGQLRKSEALAEAFHRGLREPLSA